jgi:chromosome segregation ATPase
MTDYDYEYILTLEAEVARLQGIEVERDLLKGELNDMRKELNSTREKFGYLKDALDGMSLDMGQMEETIRELSGREPDGS